MIPTARGAASRGVEIGQACEAAVEWMFSILATVGVIQAFKYQIGRSAGFQLLAEQQGAEGTEKRTHDFGSTDSNRAAVHGPCCVHCIKIELSFWSSLMHGLGCDCVKILFANCLPGMTSSTFSTTLFCPIYSSKF